MDVHEESVYGEKILPNSPSIQISETDIETNSESLSKASLMNVCIEGEVSPNSPATSGPVDYLGKEDAAFNRFKEISNLYKNDESYETVSDSDEDISVIKIIGPGGIEISDNDSVATEPATDVVHDTESYIERNEGEISDIPSYQPFVEDSRIGIEKACSPQNLASEISRCFEKDNNLNFEGSNLSNVPSLPMKNIFLSQDLAAVCSGSFSSKAKNNKDISVLHEGKQFDNTYEESSNKEKKRLDDELHNDGRTRRFASKNEFAQYVEDSPRRLSFKRQRASCIDIADQVSKNLKTEEEHGRSGVTRHLFPDDVANVMEEILKQSTSLPFNNPYYYSCPDSECPTDSSDSSDSKM